LLYRGMSAKPLILVVDDDLSTVEALSSLLEDEGYDVLQAFNGKVALNQLRTLPRPNAIILDLMMPVMDGWEFRRQQQQMADAASIPVVVVSALRQAKPFEGAAAVLTKPLDIDALLGVMNQICHPSPR
jgi:CheY-like chemotaxis protein